MNVDEQKATHVGEGRGSPLVLKPVQRRQHQCFVLRSVIFSVTEFQSLNASLCEQDFGHWPRDFHLAKTHHIRTMFLFFSCRREATHRQVYVFREISLEIGVWVAAGKFSGVAGDFFWDLVLWLKTGGWGLCISGNKLRFQGISGK